MKLLQHDFVAKGKTPAGEQLFEKITAPDSPVEPTFINVRCDGGFTIIAVPAESKDQFEPRSGFNLPLPKNEKQFEKQRKDFQRQVGQNAALVHQRGYGITDAKSVKPWLSTGQVAPCIALMIYCRDSSVGALAHFDADMDTSSVSDIIDEFPSKSALEFSFFGGKEEKSKMTCIGLLQALYELEKNGDEARRFSIRRFDVIDRPHSSEVTLDTSTGDIHASFTAATCTFDSEFRRIADGIYLTGGGAEMAGQCEQLEDAKLRKAARNVRKQFDGRVGNYDSFVSRVEKVIYDVTADTAIQRSGKKADKSAIIARLQGLGAPELVEASLQSYLSPSTKSRAGDDRYVVEVIIKTVLNDLDLARNVETWLKTEKARIASQK